MSETDSPRETEQEHITQLFDIACEAWARHDKLSVDPDLVRRVCIELLETNAEVEQLQVQLAGCSVAALGGANGKNDAHPGDYGHSASFQDVKDLRARFERLLRDHEHVTGKRWALGGGAPP